MTAAAIVLASPVVLVAATLAYRRIGSARARRAAARASAQAFDVHVETCLRMLGARGGQR